MKKAGLQMSGLSLHYYTVPGNWANKGSATEFDESEWFITLKKTLYMDELLTKHSAIMDQYDPDKRVALIVDEWGTWYDVEPGTNPGFLYQQNTMRDALVAGINLNIFHRHCNRVQMANIAQVVNVLQSMILTEGARIILTPTYHVFNMYKVHQDAELLALDISNSDYTYGEESIPRVSASASVNKEGIIHISLCNLNLRNAANIECELRGNDVFTVSGTLLTAREMNLHNTFDNPELITPVEFNGASIAGNMLKTEIPPMSVVVLAIK